MDLNSGQRKAVFGLIVVALVGSGIYMFVPGARGGEGGHRPPAAAHSPAPPATSPATPTPSAVPTAAATPSNPDIYQWLPFTQAQLGSAAAVVTQFCDAYGTWSYSQNASSYVATMRSMITSELADVIEQGYSVPGVASQRTSKKQVSTGSTVINSIRAFGSSSITFVVAVAQKVTSTQGTSRSTIDYAVTVAGADNHWQVNDVEPASAGNT